MPSRIQLQAELEPLLVDELPFGVGDPGEPRELAGGDHVAPVGLHRLAPLVCVYPLAIEPRLLADLAHRVPERVVVDRREHDERLGALHAEAADGRQRLLDVAHRVGAERGALADARRDPGMAQPDLARAALDRGQRVAPVLRQRLGQQQLAHDLVEHQVEQVVLGRHVGVERHRPDADAGGDVAHRDGLVARVVGDRERRLDDLLARQRLRGACTPAWLAHGARWTGPDRRPPAIAGSLAASATAATASSPPTATSLVIARLHFVQCTATVRRTMTVHRTNHPAISATGLGKRYGDRWVLRDVDLDVPAGTVLGLLGPNGAGKTTAVRILTTLLRPDAGTARVAGFDVATEDARVRARIGLAGQAATVDELLTGRANLELVGRLYKLGGRAARARADELLERFCSPTPPTGSRARTPAACAAGSTSPRASSPRRRCCSSTSRRPGSTRARATSCGTSCASWSTAARRSCSPPSTWTRPTGWPTASR